MEIYVVKPGDTLTSVGRRYSVSAGQLITFNMLPDDRLVVGQTLCIPAYRTVHTVEEGETLTSIARKYGVTLNQLWRNNPLLGGLASVYPGQTIVIEYDDSPSFSMTSNGYAYPFIDRSVLRMTMPYLTYMTVFTYGFEPDGSLIVPDDGEIVRIAREYGTVPVMLISTLTDEGTFSNELASQLLNSPETQRTLINNILAVMSEKGYGGLDIDFEYVFASDAQAYVDFVALVRNSLSAEGYFTAVALAPKTSGDQKGLLYEGHDYPALGEAADYVLLMTYEWGYTYGPPMAVAPINKVREVLDYAVTVIPREKIFMGIPNYGYVWKLPYIKGESKADSISNVGAVDLAKRVNAAIQFDETAQSPYFGYYENNTEYVCWFEDARSIEAKLALIREYGLNGGSWWNIMRYFPQNWIVLNSRFNIERL